MDINNIRELVAKAKTVSIADPVPTPKKKRHRPSKGKHAKKELHKNNKITKTMEKFVDFEMSYQVHRDRHNVVVVSVKGHIPDHKCINTSFTESIEDELYARGSCGSNRLILDLRRVFFVSRHTAWTLLVHHMPWLHMCFDKVAMVLPPSEVVQRNLASVYTDWGKLPGFGYTVVERASHAREFINK